MKVHIETKIFTKRQTFKPKENIFLVGTNDEIQTDLCPTYFLVTPITKKKKNYFVRKKKKKKESL